MITLIGPHHQYHVTTSKRLETAAFYATGHPHLIQSRKEYQPKVKLQQISHQWESYNQQGYAYLCFYHFRPTKYIYKLILCF